MEIHQIRYFLAVCETLNFTRAAESCNVTQPALTRAVQKLEDELGELLLRRERRFHPRRRRLRQVRHPPSLAGSPHLGGRRRCPLAACWARAPPRRGKVVERRVGRSGGGQRLSIRGRRARL